MNKGINNVELVLNISKSNKEFQISISSKERTETDENFKPYKLSKDCFEIIVFKNKFESYRSENYKKQITN